MSKIFHVFLTFRAVCVCLCKLFFALLYEEQFHVPQIYNFIWFAWYLKGEKNTAVLTYVEYL